MEKKNMKPGFSMPATMVTFVVGSENLGPEEFIVHKEHACYYSRVFKAAFNGEFIEGQTQTYRLDDVSPDVFRLLVQWLYSQALDGKEENRFDKKINFFNFFKHEMEVGEALVALWILAERLIMPRLQNATIKKLAEQHELYPFPHYYLYNVIYDSTMDSSSQLRRFIVQTAAGYAGLEDMLLDEHKKAYFPKEMLIDIILKTRSNLDIGTDDVDAKDFLVPTDDEGKDDGDRTEEKGQGLSK